MKREHKGQILLALATYTEVDADVEGLYEQYRELLGVDELTARQAKAIQKLVLGEAARLRRRGEKLRALATKEST